MSLRLMRSFVALTLLAVSTLPLVSRAQSDKVSIPERTEISLVLMTDLKSGESKEDSDVPYEVKSDVLGPNNVVLIKAGTKAFGKVTQSKRRGMFGKAGKLEFTCEYIQMPDNTHIPLRAEKQSAYGKDNRSATVAAAVLFAPVAVFVNGKDVSVEKGKLLTMYVDHTTDASLRPAAAAGSPSAGADPWASAGSSNGSGNSGNGSSGSGGSSSAPAAAAKSVFVMADGTAVVGTLVSFDGASYVVRTESGQKTLKASEVKSVNPVR